MQQILIADASLPFSESLQKQLEGDFVVHCCHDGRQVLEYINVHDPDVLVLNMMLPGLDGFSIIDALRTAGKMTRIIPVLPIHDEMVMAMLSVYDIGFAFSNPCSPELVAGFLRQYTGRMIAGDWSVESYLDATLLRMGFPLWHKRYLCVQKAILLRYCGEDAGVTKGVYPIVAKKCGGNSNNVEKAIRDLIRHAWSNGDKAIWNTYFSGIQLQKCPSNDMFISRMALALRNKERARMPVDSPMKQHKIG